MTGVQTCALPIYASGGELPSSTYVQGAVSAVEQSGGQTLITINGGKVPLGQVTSVTEAAAAATSSNSAGQTPAQTA